MCYSAEAWTLLDNFRKETGSEIDIKAFWEIYLRRDEAYRVRKPAKFTPKIPKGMDLNFLPPYEVLDEILEALVEKEMRVVDVVALGHDIEIVRKIERLLYIAEYKRRQAAPGVKVTRKNFGRDRRYPITNRFRDPGLGPHVPDDALTPEVATGMADGLDF